MKGNNKMKKIFLIFLILIFVIGCSEVIIEEPIEVEEIIEDDNTENNEEEFDSELADKKHEEFLMYREGNSFEEVKHDLLGQMVKLSGRVQKNSMFDRLEFVSQMVFRNPDPQEEIAKLQ